MPSLDTPSLTAGWKIQIRVIKALLIRELTTRFGRENIGFLWMMAEPALFAVLVALLWRFVRGPEEHGIGIIAFTVSGYIPLVLFRHAVNRATGVLSANHGLLYHRQVKILDLVLARFLIELVGAMMAYVLVATVLFLAGLFPMPHDLGLFMLGWGYWSFISFAVALVIAPLSQMHELVEKLIPVTTYVMVPLSGAFHLMAWLTPGARAWLAWSPLVHGMEMMRFGMFGHLVWPHYSPGYPLAVAIGLTCLGLALSRRVRRTMAVE